MDTETRRPLRPEQRALTWGSHWIRPIGDPPSPHYVEVGQVLTRSEIAIRAERRRLNPTEAVDLAEADQIRDLLDCIVFTRVNSSGGYDYVSRRSVWPIRPELFRALKRGGYDPRNLRAQHNEWAQAYANYCAMIDGTPPPRRPFVEFLNEVEQLARIATAHNSGQTYFGYNRIADRRIVMHMSSWPRAAEAIDALQRHGFRAQHTGTNHIDCWDRSEVES